MITPHNPRGGGAGDAWMAALEALKAAEAEAEGSLAERVATMGPLTPAEAFAALGGPLQALEAAHAAALVAYIQAGARDDVPCNPPVAVV